jgi:hypothetical protein
MSKRDVTMLVLPGLMWIMVAGLALAGLCTVRRISRGERDVAQGIAAAFQHEEAMAGRGSAGPWQKGDPAVEQTMLSYLIKEEDRDMSEVLEAFVGMAMCALVLQWLAAVHFKRRARARVKGGG